MEKDYSDPLYVLEKRVHLLEETIKTQSDLISSYTALSNRLLEKVLALEKHTLEQIIK